MTINLAEVGNRTKTKQTDPREIFMVLPHKDKKFEYPRLVKNPAYKPLLARNPHIKEIVWNRIQKLLTPLKV